MSKRLNLRDFQQRLSDRLQDQALSTSRINTLGVQIAGSNYLVEMTEIGEVLSLPTLTRVPLTQPWFLGVANVRGNLYSVVDMADYLGGTSVSGGAANRMLLVADRYAFNAALLVERVYGLRDARSWRMDESDGQVSYYDEQQQVEWRLLDIPALLAQPQFLNVGN